MKGRMKIIGGIIVSLVLAGVCLLVVGQEFPEVILRYKFHVDDIQEYECITEKETEREGKVSKEKYLSNIKENFKYEVQEPSPERYFKVKLSVTRIEEKGVSIIGGKKEESYYSKKYSHNYDEFLTIKGELFKMLSETPRGKKPYIFRQKMAKELGLPVPEVITNTNPLLIRYDDMIRYFRPVMPEEPVGINDTWTYNVVLLTADTPLKPVFKDPITMATFTYKVVAFEKKKGFDCIKIKYNCNWDITDKLKALAEEMNVADKLKHERNIKGSGIYYFAYNEGFLVSRKENLMLTDIETRLIEGEWTPHRKKIVRIGFTMNYIKP